MDSINSVSSSNVASKGHNSTKAQTVKAEPYKEAMPDVNVELSEDIKAAESEGNIGPNLDTVSMTVQSVTEMVTYGLGVMPAFGEDEILTKEEIDIVSKYVVSVANK